MDWKQVTTILYVIGFLDLLAVSLVVPLLSKHAKNIGASPSVAGIIGSVYGGLQLFSSPFIGRWSDVSGRRFVLLCCLGLSAVGYFLLGMSTSMLLLLLARIPAGLFKHTQDLARGYLADIVPADQQSKVFGRLNAVSSVGFIIGPTIGGHMMSYNGGYMLASMATASIFLLNLGLFKQTQILVKTCLADNVPCSELPSIQGQYFALSTLGFDLGPSLGGRLFEEGEGFTFAAHLTSFLFVVNAVIAWCFVPAELSSKTKPTNQHASSKSVSFTAMIRDIDWSQMWDIFLVRFLMGFAVMVYRNNFVLMLEYKYAANAKTTGYITSYSGAVGTVSGFFVGKIAGFYNNDSKLLLHAGIMQFLSLVLMTFSPSLSILVLSMTPLSVANQVARVCSTNLMIKRGHGQRKGVLLGFGGSILAFARMLSPTLGGIAQEYYVAGPSLLGCVCAGLGVTTMLLAPEPGELPPSVGIDKAE